MKNKLKLGSSFNNAEIDSITVVVIVMIVLALIAIAIFYGKVSTFKDILGLR